MEQAALIDRTIGCCRLVYNLALQVKITSYKDAGINISAYSFCKQLTDLKSEYTWLNDIDSQALQSAVKRVDVSFRNFFRGNGFPKYKSKHGNSQSFCCPNNRRKIDWGKSLLTIPKIPNIPIVISRKFDGKIKIVTISKTPTGKYFASILVENGVPETELIPVNKNTAIGLDTGIKSFVVSSDGRTFEANRKLKSSLKRLKCLQRRASLKKKGSNNRKKANKAVATLHEQITNKRLDYIHKTTHAICDNQAVSLICIEDLNVSGILKNHKLAHAMSDISLGKFYEILTYKCKWRGINLIKIDRFAPSSKRCSCCGSIKEMLKLSEREWTCESCGTIHDRDKNAAENIKWYGLETIFKNNTPMGSRGELVELSAIAETKKQE